MPFSSSSPQTEAARFRAEYHLETLRLRNQYHDNSVSEAQAFIDTFIRSRWGEHLWASLKVTCSLTMIELQDIGRLCREEGIRECGSLIRVPFIHQEIAAALWEYLATAHGRLNGEEPDEQEVFEREVAVAVAREEHDKRLEDKSHFRLIGQTIIISRILEVRLAA
ncbi:hypothetical protein BR93DRAFT_971530 [Coniochaeta sp. PMI_546]|nr:hypothetical protein BR93DRAFT_971530 [Coniochaeta sp. PMI_546]